MIESGSTLSETGKDLKETARRAARDIRDEAGHLVDDAKQGVIASVEDGKRAAAGQVGNVASSLHRVAEDMPENQKWLSGYVHQAAEGLEQVSRSIEEQDLGSLVGEVEDFARRQPALFVGASVALGFALARFVKSSAPPSVGPAHRHGPTTLAEPGYREPASHVHAASTGAPHYTYGTVEPAPVMPGSTALGIDRSVSPRPVVDAGGGV